VPTIVCFGDSNTHGSDPRSTGRLGPDVRWPGVLRRELGPGFEVVEEGLPGRTTAVDDPLSPGRDGSALLQPILWTHEPVDLVIVMLGTNDLKVTLRPDPARVAHGAARLVDLARQSLAGPGETPPLVLLVAPVPLAAPSDSAELWGFDERSIELSRDLARRYRVIARDTPGVAFFDAGSVATVSRADGVHLDPEAHAAIGQALAAEVRRLSRGR